MVRLHPRERLGLGDFRKPNGSAFNHNFLFLKLLRFIWNQSKQQQIPTILETKPYLRFYLGEIFSLGLFLLAFKVVLEESRRKGPDACGLGGPGDFEVDALID
jgi:hypothetical protein